MKTMIGSFFKEKNQKWLVSKIQLTQKNRCIGFSTKGTKINTVTAPLHTNLNKNSIIDIWGWLKHFYKMLFDCDIEPMWNLFSTGLFYLVVDTGFVDKMFITASLYL